MENGKPFDTLFLDRDGVINVHIEGDYVKSISEFIFANGALEGLEILSSLFRRIFIVTNQRGVGRGFMHERDLADIHNKMLRTIEYHNGRIDNIYICTETEEDCPDRKPNTGLILQAKRDFPDINLSDAWMVGDSPSDMQLAVNAGLKGILVGGRYTPESIKPIPVYAYYKDLLTFAKKLRECSQKELCNDHLLSVLRS